MRNTVTIVVTLGEAFLKRRLFWVFQGSENRFKATITVVEEFKIVGH